MSKNKREKRKENGAAGKGMITYKEKRKDSNQANLGFTLASCQVSFYLLDLAS